MEAAPVIDWSQVDAASRAPTRHELAIEALTCLGATMCLNGLPVPPITAGALVLLAAVDSPLLSSGKAISASDVQVAMMIIHGGREAVSVVQQQLMTGTGADCDTVAEIITESGVDPDMLAVYIRDQIGASVAGFAMMPTVEGEEERPFAFDAVWLAYYTSRLCPATGLDLYRATWELPLAMGGFILAQLAVAAGVKGVERRTDDRAALAEIDRQMEAQHGRE